MLSSVLTKHHQPRQVPASQDRRCSSRQIRVQYAGALLIGLAAIVLALRRTLVSIFAPPTGGGGAVGNAVGQTPKELDVFLGTRSVAGIFFGLVVRVTLAAYPRFDCPGRPGRCNQARCDASERRGGEVPPGLLLQRRRRRRR